MDILNGIKYRLIEGWGFTLAFLLSVYFLGHALGGSQTIHDLKALDLEISQLEALAEITHQERLVLENRITALQAKGMDPDLLEEQVRRKLGFAHPDEVVLLNK